MSVMVQISGSCCAMKCGVRTALSPNPRRRSVSPSKSDIPARNLPDHTLILIFLIMAQVTSLRGWALSWQRLSHRLLQRLMLPSKHPRKSRSSVASLHPVKVGTSHFQRYICTAVLIRVILRFSNPSRVTAWYFAYMVWFVTKLYQG